MVDAKDTAAPISQTHFADANEEGSIMYIQQPKGMYSACWGGLMSTRAAKLGATGVIIDGRFRDIGEHQELGFPVSPPTNLFSQQVLCQTWSKTKGK
jgi:regulator of RNase E activity RraA